MLGFFEPVPDEHRLVGVGPVEVEQYLTYPVEAAMSGLPDITELWRRGSVIGSWLLDLTAASLQEDAELSNFSGRVSDSGEGRWTLQAAIDEGVPAPVISSALFTRFASRGNAEFADKLMSAMRFEFGGHHEKKA